MRETEEQTIATYVHSAFARPEIQKIVENWRVDPAQVLEMLTDHFKDMGIFRARRSHHPWLFKTILNFLKHSPELQQMVTRTYQDELRKAQRRHAD